MKNLIILATILGSFSVFSEEIFLGHSLYSSGPDSHTDISVRIKTATDEAMESCELQYTDCKVIKVSKKERITQSTGGSAQSAAVLVIGSEVKPGL